MVTSCCAKNCNERYRKGSGVTFHSFPINEEMRAKWIVACRRMDFVPNRYTKICSRHFKNEDFNRERFGGTWLKANAVPSLFDFSQRKKRSRRSSKFPNVHVEPDVPGGDEDCSFVEEEEEKMDLKYACDQMYEACSSDFNQADYDEIKIDPDSPDLIAEEESAEVETTYDDVAEADAFCTSERRTADLEPDTYVSDEIQEAKTESSEDQLKKRNLRYIGDFHKQDMTSEYMLKKFFMVAKEKITGQRNEIRSLRKTERELKGRIRYLKKLLKEARREQDLDDGSV